MPARLPLLALAVVVTMAASCDVPRADGGTPPGCGVAYAPASETPYVMPFPVGTHLRMGLANCSASFHSAGQPDALAYDFDLPEGTAFVAARAGTVAYLDDDEPSTGGGAGNYVFVDHGDGTGAYYLHSPAGGISVEVGDRVAPGDTLGVVGRSGLAGYPHLHFIVVEGDPAYPYTGVPVSFFNASPADVPLGSGRVYRVLPY